MNNLIKITTNDNDEQLVSGRELHEFLGVATPYKKWVERMIEYGFAENTDFVVTDIFVHNSKGGKQFQADHVLKLDMAKEISMIQRTEKANKHVNIFCKSKKLGIIQKWLSNERYKFKLGK